MQILFGFKFDPSQSGLRNILREWEELTLRSVWDVGEDGANSRASIIMFLDKKGGKAF